ncbi:armadillo-type protein [Absidia repens]|uniref:Armadillo-type protein n=1 Tax=Absidia repens TaxID=90262 RepID=A0A1X2IHW3_9FUNG|nr:armadillo-type protein [Absidia repens]
MQEIQERVQSIIAITDDNQLIEAAASINEILGQLSTLNETWTLCTDLVRYLGDSARNPSVRLPLGEAGIIQTVTQLLMKDAHPTDFDVQAMRVLGNLSIDRDENRQRVLDSGVIVSLNALFDKKDIKLNMVLCGFCLNSSMNFEPIQKAIAENGCVNSLFDILSSHTIDTTESMALKALDNVMGQDQARISFMSNPSNMDTLLLLFIHAWKIDGMDDLDVLDTIADILLQVVMDDDKAQLLIMKSGKLHELMAFLNDDVTLDDDLQDDKEEMEKLAEIKKTLSNVVIYATSSDDLIEQLYNDQQFLAQLIQMTKDSSEILQRTGVNIIGNLARTDAQCIDLVKTHGLDVTLIDLFKNTDNAMIQNTILGCLKHLCLPKENKMAICDAGAIELAATLLDPSKDMVKRNQFLAIVILKLLCTNNITGSRRLLNNNPSILDMLVSFLQRVDDVAAKSETTRVFIQLIKSVWSQPDDQHLRQQLLRTPILNAVIEMIRTSKFPVLKNDGIIALTVILADHDSPTSKSMLSEALPLLIADPPTPPLETDENASPSEDDETRPFLPVIADDIRSANLPIEIRCNACTMLEHAIKTSTVVNNSVVYESLKQQSLPLLDITEPSILPYIQKIRFVLD